ncbi:protein piccolo-like [Rhincodon typus]|uniref:protein piccolo-like n=1 Tax=Rhincodon typus TaxID=259920 RepID=UPI00202FAC7A|nr:protein piccolo-like [Rhincodon typus]
MARAKILQDIDRELELVERESSKLRKKQAELDEEEKEIDAKLRYLEMGINRRKEALLKEREKRERAYLQGVAEERDYMSDSEVSNIRETRIDAQRGLERPRTAPQPDYDQFLLPQTQSQPQYATTPSHYTQYQYPTPPLTQTQTQYQQQSPYQEQALYHQQVSPYQTPATYQTVPTITYQQQPPPSQAQSTAYPHPSQMVLIQQKPRQTTLVDLEPKITTNYEVIHNQSLLMASTSADSTYAVPHLGSKYSNLDLRIGLDERGTVTGSPISSLSAESYYADLEHRAPRNYVLIDDIGELTKGSSSLVTGFNLHDIQKQVHKNERLLGTSEARRTADMKDFIGPLQSSTRLQSYGKTDEDAMEDPYELKLLKQQIKQEFRRGAEGLEHLSSLPQYYQADSSYRHFPKSEKYSISRLTLEKQAAKQLPPSIIYQKQSKHKKQLLDPKFSKFSPIQEARDVEPDFTNYMGTTSAVTGAPSRARLIQDDVTFSLRKNIRDQQKFLGPTVRSTFDDEIDKAYTSGTRSRPSSVYGLDLTIKRDPSSTSLRIKGQENDPLDIAYGQSTPSVRTKPSSLPISHSRGRITIVAQNSEEESPLSPVGQPMGMARAAAGPLPPISADTREQFGSSHSLPEVQQHMREESRTRGYDRDIAFIMDDFQHAMSDSEAYHLRREETDWFDKPRESRLDDAPAINRKLPEKLTHSRQSQQQSTEVGGKLVQYNFPHSRIRIQRDLKDQTVSGIIETIALVSTSIPVRLPFSKGVTQCCLMSPAMVQEWLCLTCQTQRALSGQLGDLGKMPPPLPISSKPKQTVPAQSGPKQSQKDPSSTGSSKPSAEPPTIPQPKETQPEKVSPMITALKEAEKKEMALKPAAKSVEAPIVVKQEKTLDQDLNITKQKPATDEEKRLPPEPVAKEDAVQQVEKTTAPKKMEPENEKEVTEIKTVKSEDVPPDTAVQKQPSEVMKVQNEQLKAPDLAQTDKEKVTMEKEEEKSDSSALQQQKSPQGLSDTGYSSDGISSSLGEIPTILQSEAKDLLKEPALKDSISQECSPSSPSDLAKLESTVLSILEAQANTVHHEKSGQHKDPYGLYSDHERERHRPRTLSITPESYSSDEEDLEDIQEEDEEALEDHDHEDKLASKDYNESYGSQGDEASRRQRYDSLEDSSESEHSPHPHRQRKVSIGSSSSDSQGSGDEEDFIRKQIIEMSAEEDASGSEEDEYIRSQLKELSGKGRPENKGLTVKHKRLSKRSSSSHDDDPGRRHSWHDVDDDDDDEEVYDESPEAKYRETKSQDNEELSLSAGGGLRRFKTIDLNSTITNKYAEDGSEIKKDGLYYEEEPELEMESLTDSPEDRSRGEGSSSLHATSSFTPGTSPTSVSSLDEDSDSSPSHKKMLGESKQQRKARHRSPGPLLPTIEDSSEEEELREEEELLREQEKQRELEQQQRKSSTKKSKKDKDELRAQRRREHPKTPPSNLSPIEDASPTEELRQAAEMEELHRSSCSEYSPSIESEPEGFEIHPEKIIEVQKVYKLPTSVSLYSPTDENASRTMHEVGAINQKSLKSAEEAYEEMMQKAKFLKNQKEPDDVFDKEPLYGGMLIEDYIYESLVEDNYNETMDNRFLNTGLDTSTGLIQETEKKLRSPDEIYEEIMKKNTNLNDAQCYHYNLPLGVNLHPHDLPSSVSVAKETFVTFPLDASEASTKIEKQLLDADAAYEEIMKRQSALLTPGTSPTQLSSPDSMSAESEATNSSSLTSTAASAGVHDKLLTSLPLSSTKPVQISSINSTMHAIPDVKITQHFSMEDDIDMEYGEQYCVDNRGMSYETAEIVQHSKPGTTASSMASTSTVTSKAFAVASTITTTISSPICSTGPVGGSRTTDFVVLSITTSEDNYTSTQTPRSTVKTTMTPLTSTTGGMSQVHPTSTTSSSGLSAGSDHVLISVPPNLDSSDVLTSTAVTPVVPETSHLLDKQSSLDSMSDKTIALVSMPPASVRVAVCESLGMTDPTSVVTLPVSLPGKAKIATTSSPAPGFSVSTTLSPSVTITASQAQITTKGPFLPFEMGSLFSTSSLHSPTHSPLPPPPPPPPPPPLPPPTFPKPVIIPKKRSTTDVSICRINTLDQSSLTATDKIFHPMPPPVPPKPASIPSALVFTTRPTDGIRPAIPPKPSFPHLPISVHRPSESQHKALTSATTLSLTLTSPGDLKLISPTSPISPHSNKSSPKLTMHSQATYVVITLPSEPGTPTEPVTCQASSIQSSVSPSKQHGLSSLPPAISLAHFTKSLEAQKIVEKGKTETVYFYQSLARGVVSTVEHEMSAEVSQPPISMLYDKVPGRGTVSVAITIPPERKSSELPQFPENGRTLEHMAQFTSDVIDLRTLSNLDVDMTDNGMDLSTFSADGGRHALVIDSSGIRHLSAIQPAIINLSKTEPDEQISVSTLAMSAGRMTVVTCTGSTTFTATTDTLEGPMDLGHSVPIPLPLMTKVDEATCSVAHCQSPATGTVEVPINLTCTTATSISGWPNTKPVTKAPGSTINGWTDVEPAEVEAVDLSTTKPHRMMVSVDELTTGIVTTIVEEEDKPVDLTAGRRNVCCDMVYKFPFGRSCSSLTQQPASTLPEDRYGYRDDHYSYGHGATHGYRGFGSMKPSMSDTNLAEAGLFLYKSKHSFDYCSSSTDAAMDLTAGKLTAGELMDYSAVCTQPQDHLSKGTLSYPETHQVITDSGMSQYSQARITPTIGSHYGMQSVLRSSGGVVYSSVASPIPSTFAITTQPGSIFSTSLSLHSSDTMPSLSVLQHIQPMPKSSSCLTTADTGREIGAGASPGLDTSVLMPNLTRISTTYHDTSSEVNFIPTETDYMQKHSIESVVAPKLSPVTSPVSEENKHLLIEREMLEFEKMKQIRLAEELERERHEIQIFREQEKLIVQRELQELQTMKQQLLYQQEEERQAQFMIQQETIAQQQMQLEQIQQLQQQLQQQLEEQKIRQIYQYTYDPSGSTTPQTTTDQVMIESQYTTAENGQFWHGQDISTTAPAMMGQEPQPWYTAQSEGIPQHLPQSCMLSSVSEMSLKDIDAREGRALRKRSSMPRLGGQYGDDLDGKMQDLRSYKKIVDSGVQTDDEEGTERCYTSRRRRTKKSVDSSVQTDDEDNQEDWDIPIRRRKSRVGKYTDGGPELEKAKRPHFAKLSNIAMQTVAEISVQTEPEGIIRTPSIRAQVESKIEIIKHISAPEKTYKGESLGCQTETDSDGQSPQYLTHKVITVVSPQKTDKKRPTPLEIGYSNHLRADSAFQVVPSPPKSPKVLYSPISPMTPNKELETAFVPYEKSPSVDKTSQKLMALEPPKSQPLSPRTIKVIQRSMSDPKPLSPTAEESSRLHFQYNDSYLRHFSTSSPLEDSPEAESLKRGGMHHFPRSPCFSHVQVSKLTLGRKREGVQACKVMYSIYLNIDFKAMGQVLENGNGLGIRIIGGKEIPGRNGEIGAYVAKIFPGGHAEQSGELTEGMQVLEWNGIPLTGKTYEEVQGIIGVPIGEAEICVRLDLNMLSDLESLQHLELHSQAKAGEKQKSPGVDPKQLAAELQKVSQEAPSVVTSATEKGAHSHSGTTSATSSAAPSPGQPGSPAVSKKRHSSKPPETASKSHPITGEIQLQMNYDKHIGNLIVHVLQARNLAPRDNNGYSDPFVKVYLLPGRGQVMVVQNASVENKRRTKHVQKSLNPEWNQTVIYKSISMEQLKKKTLEVTVWDYDRLSSNDFLGEGSEGDLVKLKMHVATIEKSQSSPASSKSSSEGHLRSHGPSRSQSKTSVTQTHLEDAGAAIAAAEAAVQQLRLQPTHKSGQAQSHARKHRHSIAGVPIQRTQSDNLPSPANENKDQSQLAIRKVMSEGSPKSEGDPGSGILPAAVIMFNLTP